MFFSGVSLQPQPTTYTCLECLGHPLEAFHTAMNVWCFREWLALKRNQHSSCLFLFLPFSLYASSFSRYLLTLVKAEEGSNGVEEQCCSAIWPHKL